MISVWTFLSVFFLLSFFLSFFPDGHRQRRPHYSLTWPQCQGRVDHPSECSESRPSTVAATVCAAVSGSGCPVQDLVSFKVRKLQVISEHALPTVQRLTHRSQQGSVTRPRKSAENCRVHCPQDSTAINNIWTSLPTVSVCVCVCVCVCV